LSKRLTLAGQIPEEAMTHGHDVFSPKSTIVGCALLLFAACSDNSGGTTARAQGGQNGTGGTAAGGNNGSGGTTSSSNGGAAGSTTSAQGGGGNAGTTSSSNGGAAGSTTSAQGGGGNAGTTSSSNGGAAGSSGRTGGTTGSGQGGKTLVGGTTASGGQAGGIGGQAAAGASGSVDAAQSSGGAAGTGAGGSAGGASGKGGGTGTAGQTGTPGIDAGLTSSCTGKEWPTADATKAGPFQVKAEKGVGPSAGYTPDPIYGDKQQKFNIYRPSTLESSGYCHPILVWSNGHTDNPEENKPDCVVDSAANKWCGQYLPVMQHLASHGFVVIASLSTTTSKSDPTTGLLPSIVGLEWLLAQAEDSKSAYYHRLDTAHIGAFGHSEGGMATCMMAKDRRFSAISTVSGTSTISTIYMPAVFFCGGKETNFDPPMCDSNLKVANTISTQPSMLIDALDEDHGSWAYDGASGVAISGFAAWFRLHLMGDTAQRKRFYGDGCTFCTDNRVKVLYRNSLMTQ
jgi:hypothetical protein